MQALRSGKLAEFVSGSVRPGQPWQCATNQTKNRFAENNRESVNCGDCGDFQRKGLIDVSEVLVVLFRQIRQVSSDVLRRKGRTTSSESPSFSGVESAEALRAPRRRERRGVESAEALMRARFTFRVRFTCLVRVCIVHLHHCGCMFSSLYCCACGLIRECQRGDSTSTGTGLEPHTHGLQD